MTKLEYKIGGITLDKNLIHVSEDRGVFQSRRHRFVVAGTETEALFYALCCADDLDLYKKIQSHTPETSRFVGGGSLYCNEQNNLVLADSLPSCGRIPAKIAERYGKQILPQLEGFGIRANKVTINVNGELSEYWTNKGFKQEKKKK